MFKPVYSRFGRQVKIAPVPSEIAALPVSPARPWVQQQRIFGRPLCSYAVCGHGQVAAQVVYDPMYPLNGSASTYFRRVAEPRILDFVARFAAQNAYHGQVAFDFIDDGREIYVIECNPRATSGIHLLVGALSFADDRWHFDESRVGTAATVSKKLWPLFARQVRGKKTLRQVRADYAAARDVLAGIPARGLLLAASETAWQAWRQGIAFTDASTADIEWNGDTP